MDLLSAAYGTTDDDDATDPSSTTPPPPKRPRWEPATYLPPPPLAVPHLPPPQAAAPLAAPASGRYVSKRERSLLAASWAPIGSTAPLPPTPAPEFHPPAVESPTDSNIQADVLHSLRCQRKPRSTSSSPLKLSVSLMGHTKAVSCVDWSPSHGHLLASAGMDHTVHIWNVWNKENTTARVLKYHAAAVKDVRWSLHHPFVLSGGFDCSARLVDVVEGKEIRVFKEDQTVEVIKFNPSNSNVFLSGGSKGSLKLWDIRSGLVTKEFDRSLGTILDIEFSADGKQFISSTDTTRSNISENSIIVWDVLRQVPLSNQRAGERVIVKYNLNIKFRLDMREDKPVWTPAYDAKLIILEYLITSYTTTTVYTEAFTCPCVRYHPCEASFVAQSNGNYIAIFSARPPFKLNRYRRFEGHGVWGFPIKCSFSLSGRELASGSSDGCIYFYDYKSSKLLRKIEAFKETCTYVAYHPIIPNVIASCGWTGELSVFE